MQANRFHLGKVIEELEQNIIDTALMEEAKIKSRNEVIETLPFEPKS